MISCVQAWNLAARNLQRLFQGRLQQRSRSNSRIKSIPCPAFFAVQDSRYSPPEAWKKLRTAQLRHQDKDPGTLPFGGAIKGDLHESSELPWHSAFRIWQRIKGLSRLSRTWTMALCLSVAPSKAIFMSRLNSTRTWNAPACSDLAKDAQKGTHQSTGALARSSLCWSWRGYPEECCVFLDRAH